MGNTSSCGTELPEPDNDTELPEPDNDTDAQLEPDSAAELARLSKIPATTLRLYRAYNRHFNIAIAQSRFRARSHALRQLQVVRRNDVDPMVIARELFPQIAPDGLTVDAPGLPPSFTMYTNPFGHPPPCIELSVAAYTRICACGITAQLAVLIACAAGTLQRSECSSVCRHILNRAYNRGIIQACSHAASARILASHFIFH